MSPEPMAPVGNGHDGNGGHDALRESIAAYMMNTLPRDERARIASHLASCAECAAEARSIGPVIDALGQIVPQVAPPPELRARVLGAVTGRRPVATIEPFERRPVRASTAPAWPAWLAAAAALVVALGAGYYAREMRQRADALDAELRGTRAAGEATSQQLADVRRRADQAQASIAVLTAPDLARIELAGQPVAPSAAARAFFSPTRGVVLTASNLPALPPARIYQLWIISGTTPVSAGLLQPDAAGRIDTVLAAPTLPGRAAVMAVTIEPAGGVPLPTGDKYLVGAVTGP